MAIWSSRSADPMARAGIRYRPCRIHCMASSKPLPGSPSMALAGTRTSSNTSAAGPHSPMVGIGSDFQPMSRSTRKQVMPTVRYDREHHHEVGLVAVGDERLLAVDDVVAAVGPGRGADVARVRARPGFGDREAGAPLTLDGGDQVALLLLVVGRVQDVVGVTAEPERHEGPAALHHQDRGHDRAEVHAAVLLGRVHAPEPAPAGLGLQFAQDGAVEAGLPGALVAQHLGLQRHDFLLDEGPHRVPDLPFLVAEREVHHLR